MLRLVRPALSLCRFNCPQPVSAPAIVSQLQAPGRSCSSVTSVAQLPVQYGEPRQVWVQSLETQQWEGRDILDLHPDVFAVYPRIDIIHRVPVFYILQPSLDNFKLAVVVGSALCVAC